MDIWSHLSFQDSATALFSQSDVRRIGFPAFLNYTVQSRDLQDIWAEKIKDAQLPFARVRTKLPDSVINMSRHWLAALITVLREPIQTGFQRVVAVPLPKVRQDKFVF